MTNMTTFSNNYAAQVAKANKASTEKLIGKVADLTSRFQAGDMAAFDELYNYAKGFVRNKITDTCKNIGSEAEDIIQDTFMAFYNHAYKIENCRYAVAWLKRTAINKTHDYTRKNFFNKEITMSKIEAKDPEKYEAIVNKLESTPDHYAADQYASVENTMDVNAILAELRPAYRDVVKAFYFEQKSIKEISIETGIPMGTLKVNLLRARSEVKEKYYA